MMPDPDLDRFLARLARLRLPNTTNPYDRTREGRRRLGNLRQYLAHFRSQDSSPSRFGRGGEERAGVGPNTCDVLLIAEAYGYRGGRVTGVPLSSEAVIEGDAAFRRWFPTLVDTYEPCREGGAKKTEATASIVWRLFASLDLAAPPCCWNIVPVHPFDPERGQWSNRTPTRAEIDAGSVYCRDLIDLLKPRQVVAVGKCAARGLSIAGIDHLTIRHPSQGGATLFRTQLTQILQS